MSNNRWVGGVGKGGDSERGSTVLIMFYVNDIHHKTWSNENVTVNEKQTNQATSIDLPKFTSLKGDIIKSRMIQEVVACECIFKSILVMGLPTYVQENENDWGLEILIDWTISL